MQVCQSEIDILLASPILDIRVANIPLARDDPIEDLGPGRYFVNLKLDVRVYRAQGLPDAKAGDTAANRIYLRDKGEDCLANVLRDELLKERSLIIHDNS